MQHPDYRNHPELNHYYNVEYWIVYPVLGGNRLLADREADGIIAADYNKPVRGDVDQNSFDFYRIPKAVFDMHVAFSTYPVKDQSEYYIPRNSGPSS